MPSTKTKAPSCCANNCQPLISADRAFKLMGVFKILANDTRLRLLNALIDAGELCVSSLAKTVGMKPQAISNQLQRLLDRGIVRCRRQGTSIFYRVVNPCVTELLDRAMCIVEDGCQEA